LPIKPVALPDTTVRQTSMAKNIHNAMAPGDQKYWYKSCSVVQGSL
jgi:hypothetical protein